jgi:hypothetical protein
VENKPGPHPVPRGGIGGHPGVLRVMAVILAGVPLSSGQRRRSDGGCAQAAARRGQEATWRWHRRGGGHDDVRAAFCWTP